MEVVSSDVHLEFHDDVHLNFIAIQLAVTVVDIDGGSSNFMRHEVVLFEDSLHFGVSLTAAAPGDDWVSVTLVDVSVKNFSGFTNTEGVFVLEIFSVHLELSFDGVLYLSFRLLFIMFLLEEEG